MIGGIFLRWLISLPLLIRSSDIIGQLLHRKLNRPKTKAGGISVPGWGQRKTIKTEKRQTLSVSSALS